MLRFAHVSILIRATMYILCTYCVGESINEKNNIYIYQQAPRVSSAVLKNTKNGATMKVF